MLKELDRATPQTANCAGVNGTGHVNGNDTTTPYAQALQDTGITRQTAHQYQGLADVPEQVFEEALAEPEKP